MSEIKVLDIDDATLPAVVDRLAKELNFRFGSMLDVGTSDRPMNGWFEHWKRAESSATYTALEVDPVKVDVLRSRDINTVTDFDQTGKHDLTLALEVIEHIREADSVNFLTACASKTNKIFGLTTPNFEYWKKFKAIEKYSQCRWIPDHAPTFRPGSPNPHHHQQEMTPTNLECYMAEAFPPNDWDVIIYRAWPWQLNDIARGNEFRMYFKLFATAVRKRSIVPSEKPKRSIRFPLLYRR